MRGETQVRRRVRPVLHSLWSPILVAAALLVSGDGRAGNVDLRSAAATQGMDNVVPLELWARDPGPAAIRVLVAPAVHQAAQLNGLPVPFMLKLLGRESGFDPNAVSRAGALGIAQFMPATAQAMGLNDPFDPLQAVSASARYLGLLRRQFGNVGLAAAAYNAGPGRVQLWLAGHAILPAETVAYVRSVTGRSVLDFAPSHLRDGLQLGGSVAVASFGPGGWESRLLADLLKAPAPGGKAAAGPIRPDLMAAAAGSRRPPPSGRRTRRTQGEAALCEAVSRPGATCLARSEF
jgi:hypothetical protein